MRPVCACSHASVIVCACMCIQHIALVVSHWILCQKAAEPVGRSQPEAMQCFIAQGYRLFC